MKRWLIGLLLAGMPWLAAAQVLDFDSVCAAPPCAIGSLYAGSGVTFSPSSAPIVAAGTNGLTGPIGGGRYLSIAAFPYQATITLARQATSFSIQLARASTSSGTVTVAVTWLKAGVPVGNSNVVLTNVNTWSMASATVFGGFDSIFLSPSGGANLTFGIDGIQFGGTCNGFADVQPSDSFCNATEWLANRGVTLGCDVGQYCPSSNVTRAQMALFMQRLGQSLTPEVRRTTDYATGAFAGTGTYVCPIDYEVGPSPKVADIEATLWGYSSSGHKLLASRAVYSADGGSSWLNTTGFYTPSQVTTNALATWTERGGGVNLAPGRTYRFAIQVRDDASGGYASGASAAATLTVQCEAAVTVSNRTSSSAPFDAPATGASARFDGSPHNPSQEEPR